MREGSLMNKSGYSENPSTRKSNKNQPIQAGQFDLFGGVSGVTQLIDPAPEVIERNGVRVVGIVIPQDKMVIPGYIPEALKQARALVPEVQTSGKPPWLSAKWQTQRRKRKASV